MVFLHFFDVTKRSYEKIEIKTMLPPEVQELLDEMQLNSGLKFQIIDVTDAELFVEHYYKINGYHIMEGKFNHWGSCSKEKTPELYKHLSKYEKSFEKINNDVTENGTPDFIVWNDKEAFFVEAKSWKDGLKAEQLIWIFSKKYPVKVFIPTENIPKNESIDNLNGTKPSKFLISNLKYDARKNLKDKRLLITQ